MGPCGTMKREKKPRHRIQFGGAPGLMGVGSKMETKSGAVMKHLRLCLLHQLPSQTPHSQLREPGRPQGHQERGTGCPELPSSSGNSGTPGADLPPTLRGSPLVGTPAWGSKTPFREPTQELKKNITVTHWERRGSREGSGVNHLNSHEP